MELILTDKEKQAATWLELDDESVGRLVKVTMLGIVETSNEQGKLYFWAAALMICSAAAQANADTFKQTIDGLTIKGKKFGDWELRVKKIS